MICETTILIVENDLEASRLESEIFVKQGYCVLVANTIGRGLNLFAWDRPDLIIADITLPDGCGLEFCKEIRGRSGIPVLFKEEDDTKDEIVRCLKAGGDDYLPKPYDDGVLLAKVEALLRRNRFAGYADLSFGSISFSITSGRAFLGNEDMMLSPKEFALLRFFVLNENKTVSAKQLYEAAWGQPMAGSNRALISAISRLRGKIEGLGYEIEAERGVGYRFIKN